MVTFSLEWVKRGLLKENISMFACFSQELFKDGPFWWLFFNWKKDKPQINRFSGLWKSRNIEMPMQHRPQACRIDKRKNTTMPSISRAVLQDDMQDSHEGKKIRRVSRTSTSWVIQRRNKTSRTWQRKSMHWWRWKRQPPMRTCTRALISSTT